MGLLILCEILLGMLASSGKQTAEQWLQVIALEVAEVDAQAPAE